MPSYVELSQKFYDEIASNAMPLKWEVLQALLRSPLRLEIYLWLTYRMATLKRPAGRWPTGGRFVLDGPFATTYGLYPLGLSGISGSEWHEVSIWILSNS
jgi:hypothetical protein